MAFAHNIIYLPDTHKNIPTEDHSREFREMYFRGFLAYAIVQVVRNVFLIIIIIFGGRRRVSRTHDTNWPPINEIFSNHMSSKMCLTFNAHKVTINWLMD